MRKIRLRVSYSTRPVNARVLGKEQTQSSRDSKQRGVKKLSDKGKDRVPCSKSNRSTGG
jgi:hypothetical protein